MQRQGLVIRKKSAALLQIITHLSPKNTHDALFLNNYATINVIDPLSRIRGVGQASLFGPLDYSLRLWLDTDRLTAFDLTPADSSRRAEPERAGGARPHRRRADAAGPAVPAHHQDQGPADASPTSSTISSCAPIPTARSCASGTSRAPTSAPSRQERYSRFNGAPAAAIAIYQSPGANAVDVARHVASDGAS